MAADGIGGIGPAAVRANGTPAQGSASAARRGEGAPRFDALLAERRGTPVAFSGHAARRMEQRGVQLDDERMRRLETAIERAEAKGARDSLILLDDLALVVSIQNHTVVTAVDEASQKERVFTNIDSVVIAE